MDERYKDENIKEHLEELEKLKQESENSIPKENIVEATVESSDIIEDGLAAVSEKTGDLFSGITSMTSGIVEKAGDLSSSITEVGEKVLSGTGDIVGDTVDGASDIESGIVEGVDSASGLISGTAMAVGAVATGLLGGVKKLGTEAVEGVSSGVETLQEDILQQNEEVINDLQEVKVESTIETEDLEESTNDKQDGITDKATEIVADIKDVGSDIEDSSSEIISSTTMAVGAAATGLLGGVKKLGDTAVEGINSGANAASELVVEGKKSINDSFSSTIQSDAPPVLRPKDIFEKQENTTHPQAEEGKQKITAILSALKESKFSQDYGILMYLMAFPILLLVIWQFIQNGFSIRFALLVLLGLFFLIYRAAVKEITKEVFDLKSKAQSNTNNPVNNIMSKANYVLSGIELNLKRISYTKWLYTLFTPFLLYGIAELWKGPFDTKTSFWLFLVGFVLSFIVWPFAFRSDVKKLESLETELTGVRSMFL